MRAAHRAAATAMKKVLAKIVDVKPDEIRALWLGFVFNFMVLGSYYVIKPVRDDIGAHNGVESVSVEAEASAVMRKGASPLVGDTLNAAAGGASAALTTTVRVAIADSPAESVTVTVTVYIPAVPYVCVDSAPICGPVAADPSPQSKL